MNRDEFRKLIFPLTEFEKAKRQRKEENLPSETDSVRALWNRDENGYLILTNSGMNEYSKNSKDYIHAPIYNRSLNSHFRLIVHHRFNQREFHSTEFISVNFVYRGSLTVTFPSQKDSLVLEEGSLILMNSGIVHRLQISDINDIILGFQIEKDFLREELLSGLPDYSMIVNFLIKSMTGRSTSFCYLVSDFNDDDRIKNVVEDLFCEYLDPNSLSAAAVSALLKLFFIKLAANETESLSLNRKDLIFRIISYIESNPRNISLKSLASEFNHSGKYLSRYIKDQTGQTFSELCLNARMERARFYLTESDLSIDDIARQCGYTNLSFFYRKFRERYGVLPRAMRLQSHC